MAKAGETAQAVGKCLVSRYFGLIVFCFLGFFFFSSYYVDAWNAFPTRPRVVGSIAGDDALGGAVRTRCLTVVRPPPRYLGLHLYSGR